MNGVQKVIKVFAICLAIFIIMNILGAILYGLSFIADVGFRNDKIAVEHFEGNYKNATIIDIDCISSNLIIKTGNEVRVEANNLRNNLSSEEKNGVLKITESKTWGWSNNPSGVITVYIPDEISELKINAGAGKIIIEDISVDNFDVEQGAGIMKISNSKFNEASIDGGAGNIKVSSSIINGLKMKAGVGKIELEAKLTGNNKIKCGIGEMNITLLGNEEEYKITAEKGIGSIKIKNEEQSTNSVYGKGENKLNLEGGIGSITVDFKK